MKPNHRPALGSALLPLLLLLLGLAACSDSGPGGPGGGNPVRIVAPLEGAVSDLALVANVPTEFVVTLQLPPEIDSVTAVAVDVAATLDHVRLDGIPLKTVIARRAAALLGKGKAAGATATIRAGGDPATVCTQGVLYGPFQITHDTALTVDPPSAAADAATVQVINSGSLTLCVVITADVDATLSIDAVALDLTEGDCPTPSDFSGTWTGTYSCGNSCGDPFGGPISLVVTQNGRSATYTDQGGDTFSGRICGDTFRFEYTGSGFTERGTMTLDGPNSAVKRSTWRGIENPLCGGNCTDYLTRAPSGNCPTLTLTSGPPPAGRVGVPYSYTVTTSGGYAPVNRWVFATEPIPGLEGDTSSVLAGTPTAEAVGTWEVQVTVYDACPSGTQTISQTYSLTITQ